ncbi:hypothetical protein AWZ03_003513 [Drosophila navojoa]|uniref:Uncharacterized protein n=1 Tax=Drosophila navojoa TaxID=7232 RepID=A0A484BMK4_DRONA|nr:hypothetical protein AWZ03_003513 [Drosophila navojoa]
MSVRTLSWGRAPLSQPSGLRSCSAGCRQLAAVLVRCEQPAATHLATQPTNQPAHTISIPTTGGPAEQSLRSLKTLDEVSWPLMPE